jgi:hypothetical protein
MDLARQAPTSSLTDPRAELQAGMAGIAIMGKAVEELGAFSIPGWNMSYLVSGATLIAVTNEISHEKLLGGADAPIVRRSMTLLVASAAGTNRTGQGKVVAFADDGQPIGVSVTIRVSSICVGLGSTQWSSARIRSEPLLA